MSLGQFLLALFALLVAGVVLFVVRRIQMSATAKTLLEIAVGVVTLLFLVVLALGHVPGLS